MTKKYMIVDILATALAALFMACGSSSETGGETTCIDPGTNPNVPSAGKAVAPLLTSNATGAYDLAAGSAEITEGSTMAATVLQLDATKTYQTMDGFGFALTYSSCYNLLKMSASDREAFLKKTYSTKDGYGVSYARISLGCNDFSSREYTLCDSKGPDDDLLKNFALQSDEKNYVIPVIKEILAINPNLKIIASPWTCPQWMKVDDLTTGKPHMAWTDGHLNPDYYATYADYFVKFVQAMKAEGIDIYAVTPQNEPLNKGNCASLYMPWEEEAPFVKTLAADFEKNNLKTKIYVFDHNYNYDNLSDQQDYPVKVYNALGSSFAGSELVVGAAYHDYGGSNTELDDIHQQAPTKELIFSETSIGTWNDGRNLSKRLVADMKNVLLGTVNRHCKAVLVWNLMLDDKLGPNLDGGCQTCYGAVDISNGYKTISKNSHYYIITHASEAVETGAQRIGTSRDPKLTGITHAEFLNPDGTYGLLLLNEGAEAQTMTVSDGSRHFKVTVPASGLVSCKWKKQ